MDLYMSLASGGMLYSITKEEIGEPRQLFTSLAKSDVTVWYPRHLLRRCAWLNRHSRQACCRGCINSFFVERHCHQKWRATCCCVFRRQRSGYVRTDRGNLRHHFGTDHPKHSQAIQPAAGGTPQTGLPYFYFTGCGGCK